VITGPLVLVGSSDRNLYAFDAATGRRRWAFHTGDEVISEPAVADDTVYFGGADHQFYALDASRGCLRWAVRTTGPIEYAAPLIVEGTVYFGSRDGHIWALDGHTGEARWRFDAGASFRAAPALSAGILIFGTETGELFAVAAQTGTKEWSRTLGQRIYGVSMADNTVFVASAPAPQGGGTGSSFRADKGTLYAFDARSGRERWRFESGRMEVSPAIANGALYLGTTHVVYAIDRLTGRRMWQFDLGADEITSEPSVTGGTIYFGTAFGSLEALDAKTGAELWTLSADEPITVAPSAADSLVYFVGSQLFAAG
jgi:outer membrane protein assembly factor BamB